MKVGIIGVGLIGGSVARALANRDVKLLLSDTNPTTVDQLRRVFPGATVGDGQTWAQEADAVVLAVPLEKMEVVIRELVPLMNQAAWLVDLSSVKRPLKSALLWASQYVRVLSLHLMAGREVNGFDQAQADLFHGCPAAVVDFGLGLPPEEVVRWWQMQLNTAPFSPWDLNQHDDAIAWVSQLPYLVSRALEQVVLAEAPRALSLAGPGYRDTARVGRTDAKALAPMLQSNEGELKRALLALESKIRAWREYLDRSESGQCQSDSLVKGLEG